MNEDGSLTQSQTADRRYSKKQTYLSTKTTAINTPTRDKILAKYKSLSQNSSHHSSTVGITPTHVSTKGARLFSPKSSFCTSPEPPFASQLPSYYNAFKALSQSISGLPTLVRRNDKPAAPPAQLMHTMDCYGAVQGPVIPKVEASRTSLKKIGIVKAYAANTHQGIIRDYNEDRVAIILNIVRPTSKRVVPWPKCALFGIYDGHGGAACADFLRDSLHHLLVRESSFPDDPGLALTQGFAQAESQFLQACEGTGKGQNELLHGNKSGSCAIVSLMVKDTCYIANVGDSRAIMSSEEGSVVTALSKDHKPNEPGEFARIVDNGGTVYQTQISSAVKAMPGNENLEAPLRVFPGRLSVSRTFGDIEAKFPRYKGNPDVVIAVPDVKRVQITEATDFILLGCDGIFDKLSSEEAVRLVWNKAKSLAHRGKTIHEICGECVVSVLQSAMEKRSLDNVTVVMIAFKNFKRTLESDRTFKENLQKQAMCSIHDEALRAGRLGRKLKQTGSFVLRKDKETGRVLSPVGTLQRCLSPVQAGGSGIKQGFSMMNGQSAEINFAGIKGLIEMGKKDKKIVRAKS